MCFQDIVRTRSLYVGIILAMAANDPNHITINAYNNNVDSYLNRTPSRYGEPHKALTDWIDRALSYVEPNGSVLEVGSATPRDAQYIRNHGFTVQCSDASIGFVNHLQEAHEDAIQLNIINDHSQTPYDMVFANAVFPHFTPEDTQKALRNIYKSLNTKGILVFNVKQGEEDEWVNEKMNDRRYIHYWLPHEIYNEVTAAGYEVIQLEDGVEGDLPTHIWTRIIAQKA